MRDFGPARKRTGAGTAPAPTPAFARVFLPRAAAMTVAKPSSPVYVNFFTSDGDFYEGVAGLLAPLGWLCTIIGGVFVACNRNTLCPDDDAPAARQRAQIANERFQAQSQPYVAQQAAFQQQQAWQQQQPMQMQQPMGGGMQMGANPYAQAMPVAQGYCAQPMAMPMAQPVAGHPQQVMASAQPMPMAYATPPASPPGVSKED